MFSPPKIPDQSRCIWPRCPYKIGVEWPTLDATRFKECVMLVYVSGPYSAGTDEGITERARGVAIALWDNLDAALEHGAF